MKIQLKKVEGCEDIPLPQYMTSGSAGMDLYAAVKEPVTLTSGQIALIATGIAVAIPDGYEAQIRPRSGLALKHGISMVNTPGTIDADYRGEIGVILINFGQQDFTVARGDRIAQMVINQVVRPDIELVEELPNTVRGEGGFGHTGI